MWGWALAAFGMAWAVQAFLSIRQANHIRQAINDVKYSGGAGYLGLGVVRNRWGRGAYALVLAGPDGRVTSARLLNGVTVFARFHRDHRWEGRTAEELAGLTATPGPKPQTRVRLTVEERAVAMAAHQVGLQMTQADGGPDCEGGCAG